MVKYDDMVQLCEIQTPDRCQSTKISRVSYKLVHVVVHTGNKHFSGHYVCYMKRNWSCYFADDTHQKVYIVQLKLSMKKPTWSSTVYERDFSDDPMVEVS